MQNYTIPRYLLPNGQVSSQLWPWSL